MPLHSQINRAKHVGSNRVAVEGSFRPNGTGAVAAAYNKGVGWSVARTSVGLYTVTFDNVGNQLDSVLASARSADGIPTACVPGDYSATNKTLQLRTMRGGGVGTKDLPLGAFQEQDGTALADFSAGGTTPGWSAGDESGGIRWDGNANPDPISTQFVWPADMDPSANATLHILAAKTGNTAGDAVVWVVEMFNNVAAAAYDADADYGGESSAMTGNATAKTVQDETLTLALANLPTAPCATTLTIQPKDGTLGTDDVIIVGMYIDYQSRQLVDLSSDADNVVSFRALFRNSNVD